MYSGIDLVLARNGPRSRAWRVIGFILFESLSLSHDRVVEHARAADFLGPQPELLPQELLAVGQDEGQRVAAAGQVDDLPRLAPPPGGKQDALEADRKVRQVSDLLLDEQGPVVAQPRGEAQLHVLEAQLERAMDAELVIAVGRDG